MKLLSRIKLKAEYISTQFFENQPNEIYSHLSEKPSKSAISSKITPTKEKERRKRKSVEEERRRREKAMVALLVFIMATLEMVFVRKKTVARKKSIWQ